MKLTKEMLKQIIKEEIEGLGLSEEESVEEVAGVGGGLGMNRGRQPRMQQRSAPEPAAAAAPTGGETTMEIGQIEDIKSRLDSLIAQSGNQVVGKMGMLLSLLDAELAKQGIGVKGDYRKQRGTTSQRRTKQRQVATKGKGSAAGLGLSEGESE